MPGRKLTVAPFRLGTASVGVTRLGCWCSRSRTITRYARSFVPSAAHVDSRTLLFQCLKFKTRSSAFLNRFELLNRTLLATFQQGRRLGSQGSLHVGGRAPEEAAGGEGLVGAGAAGLAPEGVDVVGMDAAKGKKKKGKKKK